MYKFAINGNVRGGACTCAREAKARTSAMAMANA